MVLHLETLICQSHGSPLLRPLFVINYHSFLEKKDLIKDVRNNVKSIHFFLSVYLILLFSIYSKHFSCHSEAGHPLVSVALIILLGTGRVWTICCVKADCTSLSCLRAALNYLTDFSETREERRLY